MGWMWSAIHGWFDRNFTVKGLFALAFFLYSVIPDSIARSEFWTHKVHTIIEFVSSPFGRVGLGCLAVLVIWADHRSVIKRMGRPPNNGKGSLRSSSEDQPDAFKNPHWEMVSDMTFRNTNVEVDGKRFYNCEFINVTFSFHGKGPTEFLECRFGASLTLDTDHPVAMAYSKLSRVFTAVPGAHSRLVSVDAKGRDLPENFHITEIERDRRAEALATLPVHAEPKPPAEEDPKVYLDPLNSEFIARGYMAFRISNQGQRVNPAQAVSIQRITNVPSIVFDYIDRIDPAERMVIVPTVDGDHLVPHHDILPELRQAWKDAHERGELDSDEFPFTITIHYRDAKQIRFISHVSFKYSPLAEDDARRTALSAHRTEYPILRVTNTHIRRLS